MIKDDQGQVKPFSQKMEISIILASIFLAALADNRTSSYIFSKPIISK